MSDQVTPAAPPAAASSAPPASSTPTAPPASSGFDFANEIDSMASGGTPPAKPAAKPAKSAAPPAKPGKPAEAPPKKPTEEPPKKPAEGDPATPPAEDEDEYVVPSSLRKKPAEETPPGATEPDETATMQAPQLRQAYAKAKGRVAELEKELATAKKSGLTDAEKKHFTDEIERLKAKAGEYETTIRETAFERSAEYRDKYEAPFISAFAAGRDQAKKLTVNEGEESRQGSEDDFDRIMSEPNDQAAGELANDLFGSNASLILWHRMEVLKAHNARSKAVKEFRANLAERIKAEEEGKAKSAQESERARTEATAKFKALNEKHAKDYPELFAPAEGDDEGNRLLEKGMKDADLAFSGAPGLTPEQKIRLHVAIRNRAGAFSRLVHRLNQREERIKSLEAELSGIRGSAPGDGQEHRDTGPKVLSVEDEIDKLAAQNRA